MQILESFHLDLSFEMNDKIIIRVRRREYLLR